MPLNKKIAAQIHECYHLKLQGFKRIEIANELGIPESLVKTRLAQVKTALINGDIPVEGLPPLDITQKEAIEDAIEHKEALAYNLAARKQIPKLMVAQAMLDEVKELAAQSGAQFHQSIKSVQTKFLKELNDLIEPKKLRVDKEVAIQHISDLHHCRTIKGVIDEETTRDALFRYGVKTCEILAERRHFVNIDELVILINGDNMHGLENYKAQSREVSGTFSQQIIKTAMLLIEHIVVQKTFYRKIRVVVTGGNHGKKAKGDDLTTENAEFEMGHIIAAYFTHVPGVEVQVVDDNFYTIVLINHRKYFVTHGDMCSGYTPQSIVDSFKRWDDILEPFDHGFCGHFHRLLLLNLPTKANTVEGRHIFVNGTASIGDGFLQTKGSSPSLQWWFVLARQDGSTKIFPINLYDREQK